jgi:hypothetical protein
MYQSTINTTNMQQYIFSIEECVSTLPQLYSHSVYEEMFKGKNYLSFIMVKVNMEFTTTFS